MLSWWRAQTRISRNASKLYGSIVTAARREEFFSDYGVPDTKEGRFAMLVAHMVIVLRRLRREGEPGAALGRALSEAFVVDIDDCMREIGVGDLSVPRQVNRAAAALYESARDFEVPLGGNESAPLAEALRRTLLSSAEAAAASVARYMHSASEKLDGQPAEDVLAGSVAFPAP
jgi:cytochrome b pre-mRNA-processing protein 3